MKQIKLHIAEIFVKKFKKKTVWYQRERMMIKGVFSSIDILRTN